MKIPFRSFHIGVILNFVSAFLVIAMAFEAWQQFSVISLFNTPQYLWKGRTISKGLVATNSKPDIYYIVLDGYGREDILNEYYAYDNSEFLENLAKRGFAVPHQARSNYPKTVLSISSTLNMDYISNLMPELMDKTNPLLVAPETTDQ